MQTLEKKKLTIILKSDCRISEIKIALDSGYNVKIREANKDDKFITSENFQEFLNEKNNELVGQLFPSKPNPNHYPSAIAEKIKTPTKQETKQMIQETILSDDKALINNLLAVFNLQTSQEQAEKATFESNKMGFNSSDAGILTSFSEQVLKKLASGTPINQTLSDSQKEVARAKLLKYSGQLQKLYY